MKADWLKVINMEKSREIKSRIMDAYDAGESLNRIAKKFDCSTGAIRRIVNDSGRRVRSQKEAMESRGYMRKKMKFEFAEGQKQARSAYDRFYAMRKIIANREEAICSAKPKRMKFVFAENQELDQSNQQDI